MSYLHRMLSGRIAFRGLVGSLLPLLAALAVAHAHTEPVEADDLKVWGDLRLIGANGLDRAKPFSAFAKEKHLYGVGMPSKLADELLVVDGKAYLGGFRSLSYQAEAVADFDVAFFAYAYVEAWQAIPVPDAVTTFEAFRDFVAEAARASGLDPERGFLFRLTADARGIHWFVVGGMGNLTPDPRASFLRQRHLGGIEDRSIEAVGVYAPPLRGIATAPDTPLHMHFRTLDEGALFVGHIDNAFLLRPGATLYLPAR